MNLASVTIFEVAAAVYGSTVAADFLKEVVKPSANAIGERIRDAWLGNNRQAVVEQVHRIVSYYSEPKTLKVIPTRMGILISDAIEKEDDESIQALWAALIANALIQEGFDLKRAYIEILGSIEPAEARLIKTLQKELENADPNQRGQPIDNQNLLTATNISEKDCKIALYHMTSLGCFFVRTSATTFVGENSNIDPWPYITFGEREFYPTELLVDLLEAVRVIPAQPTEKKADSPV